VLVSCGPDNKLVSGRCMSTDRYVHGSLRVMFGLAQAAFPERFPSQRRYRFDWDMPSLYRCEVIRRTL